MSEDVQLAGSMIIIHLLDDCGAPQEACQSRGRIAQSSFALREGPLRAHRV